MPFSPQVEQCRCASCAPPATPQPEPQPVNRPVNLDALLVFGDNSLCLPPVDLEQQIIRRVAKLYPDGGLRIEAAARTAARLTWAAQHALTASHQK